MKAFLLHHDTAEGTTWEDRASLRLSSTHKANNDKTGAPLSGTYPILITSEMLYL
jgi:hypothetical protein